MLENGDVLRLEGSTVELEGEFRVCGVGAKHWFFFSRFFSSGQNSICRFYFNSTRF